MKATSVSVAVSNVAAWVFGLLCGVVLGVWLRAMVVSASVTPTTVPSS
jgi:hypothetical protein